MSDTPDPIEELRKWLSVPEAQQKGVCRICQLNSTPSPGNPFVLAFGFEYAHQECLKRNGLRTEFTVGEIRELEDMRDSGETEITRLRAEVDRLKGDRQYFLEDNQRLKRELERSDDKITQLTTTIDTERAKSSALREALESIRDIECELEHSDECVCCLSDSPVKIIASDALIVLADQHFTPPTIEQKL